MTPWWGGDSGTTHTITEAIMGVGAVTLPWTVWRRIAGRTVGVSIPTMPAVTLIALTRPALLSGLR